MSRRSLTTVVAAAILLVASQMPPRSVAGPSSPGALVLDNGMRVMLMPHPGSGMVASNVFVGAGSTREEERYAGSSHFLEHVLFNGTTTRTQEELYADADRIGAYNNATTRQEYTHYMMVVPTERLEAALDIQADMLLHSILPEEKFEKERGIVLEELSKDRDDPDYRLEGALGDLLYGEGSPWASPVLGTEQTIEALPRPTVIEYYRRQYVPANMRMILMGDFDPDEAMAIVRRAFDAKPESGRYGDDLPPSEAPPLPGPPFALAETGVFATRNAEGQKTIVDMDVALPAASPGDAAALALLAHIAGGSKSGRLEQALNMDPAVPHEEASASLGYRQDAQVFSMRVRLAEGASADEAVTRMLATLRSLENIEVAEMTAARTVLLTQEIKQIEQLHYYALFEGDRLWHTPPGFSEGYLAGIEDTDAEAAGLAASRLLGGAGVRVVAAGPGVDTQTRGLGSLEPEAAMVEALVPTEAAAAAPPQRSRPAPLEKAQPPKTVTLENGLTVVHSAAPSTRMFALHLLVKNRSLREPPGVGGIADLLHRTMGAIAERPGEAVASPLDRIGATLKVADNPWIPYDDYYTTPLYSFVRLECVDEYYREALELLARMLRGPFDDAGAVEQARSSILSAIQRDEARPSNRTRARLNELLYPGNPLSHSVMGDAEVIASIQTDALPNFAEGYLSPGEMILSVVGNVPRDEAVAAVEATLGQLQRIGGAAAAPPLPPLTTGTKREEIEGGGKQSSIRMGRVFEVDPEDRWALIVAVRIASDRMQQDLRETRGLAYSLGISVGFLGNRASLTASMGTRPENLEEAEEGMRSSLFTGELEVTPEELETAVNGYLSRMRMRRITSMGQAFNLGVDLFLDGSIEYAHRESQGLEVVETGDVKRAAGRYLVDAPVITVIAR